MLDYRNDDFYIGEEDYKEKMTTLVEPFIDTVEDGYFLTDDHTKIHYYYKVNPEEKGAIVISHGFCEFFGKFYEGGGRAFVPLAANTKTYKITEEN